MSLEEDSVSVFAPVYTFLYFGSLFVFSSFRLSFHFVYSSIKTSNLFSNFLHFYRSSFTPSSSLHLHPDRMSTLWMVTRLSGSPSQIPQMSSSICRLLILAHKIDISSFKFFKCSWFMMTSFSLVILVSGSWSWSCSSLTCFLFAACKLLLGLCKFLKVVRREPTFWVFSGVTSYFDSSSRMHFSKLFADENICPYKSLTYSLNHVH